MRASKLSRRRPLGGAAAAATVGLVLALSAVQGRAAEPSLDFRAAVPIVLNQSDGGPGAGTPTPTATSQPAATLTATATGTVGPSASAQPSATSTATPTATPTLAPSACGGLSLNAGQSVGSSLTDEYVWYDASCRPRTTALVRSDVKGGHAKQLTYQLADGSVRTITESPQAGGFGYVVSHLRDAALATSHGDDDSPLGSNLNAQYRTVFLGANHAIHEFTLNYPRWGVDPVTKQQTKYDMPVTIHWLFATGRDAPLWAVTFDLSAAPADAVDADTRAPYGDMLFDGATPGSWGDELGGVAWGERYRFTTTGAPFTLNSAWDWSVVNTWAPYNLIWARDTDAEMGIAGTLVNTRQDAGGYEGLEGRGHASAEVAYRCADPDDTHVMPCTWGWPFQSVNYSFPDANSTTGSKRLAWGADWGYLGKQTITTINGNTVHGWPKVSYSAYVVLGPHSLNPTFDAAQQAAVADGTTLTAAVGSVLAQGPAGVGRADKITYTPTGFNPVYGTWEANASSNRATLTFSVAGAVPLKNPIVVLHQYSESSPPSRVALDGVLLQSGVDYFVSYRAGSQELWLTLNRSLSGARQLEIGG